MQVPLLDLQMQYRPIRDEILRALTRVCDSQRFILGPEVEALEAELVRLLDVRYAIGVSSGTDALLAALMALDIAGAGAGEDEVITSPYSFFASAGCISRVGARPVFVDIDPETYNLDASAIASALTSRTRAILPIHLFGSSANMDAIAPIAEHAGVPVIEDACQAIGARQRGRLVGGIGQIGCFSFYPTKNLGGFGDGGFVATNNEGLARRIKLLRSHGEEARYIHKLVGGNFRLDELQAAVLRVKVPRLAAWTEARRRNAARYVELFESAGLLPAITLPAEPPGSYHVYNQFVVRAQNRDALRAYLEGQGIGTGLYYPVPLHLQACFRHLGYSAGAFPHAEAAARETLALPIYGELTEEQQAYVVGCIARFYGSPH